LRKNFLLACAADCAKIALFSPPLSDVDVNRAAKSFQIKVWSASLLSIKQLCAKATPSRRDFSLFASRFS
jgi:hypothetical protein